MKFRPQRGGYAESMAACVELDATYESLAKHLNVSAEDIEVNFYCHDTRPPCLKPSPKPTETVGMRRGLLQRVLDIVHVKSSNPCLTTFLKGVTDDSL